jgi:hypothetical protein
MNRRKLLSLMGLGAASLPMVSQREAARIVGLDTAMTTPLDEAVANCAPSHSSWWSSPLRITMDARERAAHEIMNGSIRYAHMKSWSNSYLASVLARDHAAMELLRQKMEGDTQFRERLFSLLAVKGGER